MRLFLAIELPEPARERLSELSREWRRNWGERLLGPGRFPYPQCSWVRERNLHLTLKFLGEVEGSRVPELCDLLRTIELPGLLSLTPDHIECLPRRGPIRVIAAGLSGDLPQLKQFHAALDAACGKIGFPPEGREYRPHITLARARSPLPDIRARLAELAARGLPAPTITAHEFVLMESRLHRDAAEYVPLARFPLGQCP